MATQLDGQQHNGLAGRETEMHVSVSEIWLREEVFIRDMYLEAAPPEDRKHTKSEVAKQCLLADRIV